MLCHCTHMLIAIDGSGWSLFPIEWWRSTWRDPFEFLDQAALYCPERAHIPSMVPTKSHIQSEGGDEIGLFPSVNPEGTPSKTSEVVSPTCKSEIRNRDPRFHFITYGFPELRTPNNSEIRISLTIMKTHALSEL